MAAIFVKMSFANLGGTIQGNFGTYVPGSDGIVSVDSRDIGSMLLLGATFIMSRNANYGQTIAVASGSPSLLVASAALSNGALAVAAQPDVPRQGQVTIGAGTSALTGGTITIPYRANDGTLQTDVIPTIVGASGVLTSFLSKGVVHLNSPTIAGIVGGASPYVFIGTNSALSVPVDPGAVDIVFTKETINTGDEVIGTVQSGTLATIIPTTAPNGTHTYGFGYAYNAPTS